MRLFFRLLGLFFLLLALWVLVKEALVYWERGTVALIPLGQLWYDLDHGSLNLTQAVIERYLWQPLWDPGLITLLQQPALVVFGLLAVLLLALTQVGRRRPHGGARRKRQSKTAGSGASRWRPPGED